MAYDGDGDGKDDLTGVPMPKTTSSGNRNPAAQGPSTPANVDATQTAAAARVILGEQAVTSPSSSSDPTFIIKTGFPTRPQAPGLGASENAARLDPEGLDYYKIREQGWLGLNDPRIKAMVVAAAKKLDTDDYESVFNAVLDKVASDTQAGKNASIAGLLNRIARDGAEAIGGSGPSGGGSGGPFSSVNRAVKLTDAGTARQLLNQALSGYLGRQATADEQAKFLKALNVQEKANPQITSTTGYADGAGNQTSSTVQKGGFNSADFTERFAKAQEGYAEYQAATTYLDAFIGALENKTRVI